MAGCAVETGYHYMNSVAKQEYYIILGFCHSVGGQRLLTNVDTAEQLWLECSQDQLCRNNGNTTLLWNDQRSDRNHFGVNK